MRHRTPNKTSLRTSLSAVCPILLALSLAPGCASCGDDEPQPTGDMGADMAAREMGPDMGDDDGTNSPPEASATADDPVAIGSRVSLDASGSSDPEGDALRFTWSFDSKPQGSTASLTNEDSAQSRFVADLAGSYELTVEVSDGVATDSATVTVTALDEPVAEAGPDRTGEVGTAVQLDGTGSTSPGGEGLTYQWRFVTRPDSSSASFADPDAAMTETTPDVAGTYVLELVVSNGAQEASDRATLEVAPEGGRLTSTVFVAPTGDDGNTGTEDSPLATLDEAISVFRAEDAVTRIELAAGTYDVGGSTKDISSDLDISGPSPEDGEAVISDESDLFDITGEGAFVTFVDVTLESEREAVYVGDDGAVSFIGVTCRAERCVRTGGVFTEPGGRIEIRRSTLEGGPGGSDEGLTLTTPDEATIVDTTIRNFETHGIQVLDGPLTLRDSTVRENGKGVHLVVNDTVNSTRITNTDFAMNDRGIRSDGAENVTVRQSSINQSTDEGIYLNGGAFILRDSTVESGSTHGILIDGDVIVTLRESEIFGNEGAGFRVEGSGSVANLGTDIDAGDNDIYNNKAGQLYDARPDGATGDVQMSGTRLSDGISGLTEPPSGTYTGPGFDDYGIVITGDNAVVVH